MIQEARAYPYKCTCCGRKGKYKTAIFPPDFRCPHDAGKLIFQTPIDFKPQETVSAGEVTEDQIDDTFTMKVLSKIRFPAGL